MSPGQRDAEWNGCRSWSQALQLFDVMFWMIGDAVSDVGQEPFAICIAP
jgi:hypothetical protein